MMVSSRPFARLFVLFTVLAGLAVLPAAADGAAEHDPNHILVGWDASLPQALRLEVHDSIGATVANRFDWIDVDVVRVPDGTSAVRLVERYEADPRVKYAELNTVLRTFSTPNDTYFSSLWGLHNTGQFAGYTTDADIDAPEAWDIAYGSGSFPNSGGIRVGIIDGGIDGGHPEFSSKIKACARGTTGSGSITNGTCPDGDGHGTHVAGTIAAHGNNGTGVIGVAPDSELAIAKTFSGGSGYQTDSIAALYWLRTTGGARAVNMSFGSSSYNNSFASEVSAAYNAGVLLVAAAGNNGNSTVSYPAGYSQVISVAATDGNDNRASFSNYNSDVELAAPGVNIRSTIPTSSYGYKQGTSMASPHVTGVGALIMSASGVDNATARSLMTSTALDRGSSGRDTSYGYGRVNLAAALNASPLTPAITTPAEGASFNTTTITVSGTGKASAPLQVREGATVLASTTVSASRTWSTSVTLGQGAHQLTAVTNAGTTAEKVSDPRSISIDSIAPAAPVITAPLPSEVVTGATATIRGTTEPNATVLLSEAGTTIATTAAAGDGSWSATPPLAEGNHTIEAVARDAATNVGPPASVSFRLAIPPPVPTVITPGQSTLVPDGSAVTVSGTSSGATQIRVRESTTVLGTAVPAGDGGWTIDLPFTDGPHTLSVTAIDGDGDESAAASRTFLVGPAPTVTIEAPEADSINQASVVISGNATPNATVRIFESDVVIATGTANASGVYSLTKPFAGGSHTITARAELVGVQGDPTAPRSFVVDVMKPILTVYNPDPGVVLPNRNPEMAGYVIDDKGLGRVALEFTRLGGSPPEARDADCADCATELESEWVANLGNLAPGYYTATIRAIDRAGNESSPKTIRFVTT